MPLADSLRKPVKGGTAGQRGRAEDILKILVSLVVATPADRWVETAREAMVAFPSATVTAGSRATVPAVVESGSQAKRLERWAAVATSPWAGKRAVSQ